MTDQMDKMWTDILLILVLLWYSYNTINSLIYYIVSRAQEKPQNELNQINEIKKYHRHKENTRNICSEEVKFKSMVNSTQSLGQDVPNLSLSSLNTDSRANTNIASYSYEKSTSGCRVKTRSYEREPLLFRNNNLKNVVIISTKYECDCFVQRLYNHLNDSGFHAIGLDCEWVPAKNRRGRSRIALIQIAMFDANTFETPCGLIRLCKICFMPDSLKRLLNDQSVYKVGVATIEDAQFLHQDFYSVRVKSTLDLRYLAFVADYEPLGLARLAEDVCGVVLEKDKQIQCGNWETEVLSKNQMQYAADDAQVSIEIFMRLSSEIKQFDLQGVLPRWSEFMNICHPYLDLRFDAGYFSKLSQRCVIIENVPEFNCPDINIRQKHDMWEAVRIIKSVANIPTDGLTVSRRRMNTNLFKARPLKVVLRSKEDARILLRYKNRVEQPLVLKAGRCLNN